MQPYDEIILPGWAGAAPVIVPVQMEFVLVPREPCRPESYGWPAYTIGDALCASAQSNSETPSVFPRLYFVTDDGPLSGPTLYYEDGWLCRADLSGGSVYAGIVVRISAERRTSRKICYCVSRIAVGRESEVGRIVFELGSGRALAGTTAVPPERTGYWSRFIVPAWLLE